MSFAGTVKTEITNIKLNDTSKYSFLSAVIHNSIFDLNNIKILTEYKEVADIIFDIFKDTYQIITKITVRKSYNYSKNLTYVLEIKKDVVKILKYTGIYDNKILPIPRSFIIDDFELIRTYLKGVFLISGSINDPKTSRYHLEIVVNKLEYATFIDYLLNDNNLNSKVLKRENKYMVYIKESEKISDFLRIIEAFNALFYYEDIIILRDHRNMTNRLNNCEQANVDKIIESASKEVKDIELIEKKASLDLLEEKEKIVSIYRLKYREASLSELSNIISLETGNKITKSGLHHRMKKIKLLADKIRNIDK